MTPDQIKALAKQARGARFSNYKPDRTSFFDDELDEFARLVRESTFTEARRAIESANAERHIDVADCVQIIQELQ